MGSSGFDEFDLSEDILKALDILGYKAPTKVQSEVAPLLLKDRDIIVKSQTGTGKTAAFGIPLSSKALIEEREPQALILTPTRELCVQVKEELANIGRFKRLRAAAVYGKHPIDDQIRELKQRVHFVVGTPGRTIDLIDRGSLVTEKIKYLIIDEADKMLNMGFIEQIEAVIKHMPSDRVTLLFSATIPLEIEALCQRYMNDPAKVEISGENITAEKVNQVIYETNRDEKFELLMNILYVENPDSCIIFSNTKDEVDSLVRNLKKKGIICEALHGGMFQEDRLEAIKRFKNGEFRFLVATDVAGRGIDVENLTHIVNYDVPVEKESYVHRIGRTGRAGKKGKAVTLLTPQEHRLVREIEEYIGYQIPRAERLSYQDIQNAKEKFQEKSSIKPKLRVGKSKLINREITKLYIGAGKKKKIRAGDIVGAVTSIEGVRAEDIGIIDIQDNFTYIDILSGKGNQVMEGLKDKTIKGKSVKVEKAAK